MKLRICSILMIIFCCSLVAQNEVSASAEIISEKKVQFYSAVSPLMSPRVCIGIVSAKQNDEQKWIEYNYSLHGFHSTGLKNYGAAIMYNYFFSGTRRGYFTNLSVGVDYVFFTGLFYSDDVTEGITPNLNAGVGYSFITSKDSYLRLHIDVGYKWFFSNLYLSYVW